MFNRDNLFGGRGQQQPSPSRQQGIPQAHRDSEGRFRQPPTYQNQPSDPEKSYAQRPPAPNMAGRGLQLRPAKSPDNSFTFGNLCAVSAQDIAPSRDGGDTYLLINGAYVLSARPLPSFPRGHI